MVNLAIVIAISSYENVNNLPGCENDGNAINQLLNLTNRFDDILVLNEDTSSASIKSKLAAFIERYNTTPVEELFFYFTGHGSFDGEDFQYILSDYNIKKRLQTTLSNNELDGMVRSLTPELYVKIVDACQSGTTYIKSTDDFHDHLKSTQKSLNKLYFMFSSQNTQYSYQNNKISYFTDSFIKAVIESPSNSIRYKDITNRISDDFVSESRQTPIFVMQASLTEVFCDLTLEQRSELTNFVQSGEEIKELTEQRQQIPQLTLLEKISQDAGRYYDKEDALEAVNILKTSNQNINWGDTLSQLFEASIHIEETNVPHPEQIGRWLKAAVDDKYFAEPIIEQQTYQRRVPKKNISSLASSMAQLNAIMGINNDDDQYKVETAQRDVIVGFKFTTEMPFNHVRIRLTPQYKNLSPEEAYIVPIVSRTHLRIFSAFSHFEHYDWDKSKPIGKIEWANTEVELKDTSNLKNTMSSIIDAFKDFVLSPLEEKWNTSPNNDTEDK